MCTMSSSRARRPTIAWRISAVAVALAAAAALLAVPRSGGAAEGQESGCLRVLKHEAVVEGANVRVRGEVTNACGYVVRNARVQVAAQDQEGRSLGTGEGFLDPAVIGLQEVARFDVAIPTTVQPASVSIMATWRRGLGY